MQRALASRVLAGVGMSLGVWAGGLLTGAEAQAPPGPPTQAPPEAPPAAPAAPPATSQAPPTPAPAPAASPADVFAEAAERVCNALRDQRPPIDALTGLQVLGEPVELADKGVPVWALRSMTQSAFVTATETNCFVISTPSLSDPAALSFLSAVVRRAGGGVEAPAASPVPPVAAVPAPPPVPAVPAAPAASALFADLAPGSAAVALQKVCDAALRGDGRIPEAAKSAGLATAAAPAYPIPNFTTGGEIFKVPSNDGEIILFNKPDDPKSCHLSIAHVPPMVADILADRLAAAGMKKGAFGPMGEQGRFQQLVSGDGKTYANVVAFEPPSGVEAPPVRVYVQWGAN